MLYSDSERRLMADALQPNMRVDMAAGPFQNISRDFRLRFDHGARIMDLGPGQCDLLDIARREGARTIGVDSDPAVCALGRLRGHEMIEANMRPLLPASIGRCDGIFCRGSINVYWFQKTPEKLGAFLDSITDRLALDGWLWIVPWNKPVEGPGVELIDAIVAEWRARCGISSLVVPKDWKRTYGLNYTIPQTELWSRGIAGAMGVA